MQCCSEQWFPSSWVTDAGPIKCKCRKSPWQCPPESMPGTTARHLTLFLFLAFKIHKLILWFSCGSCCRGNSRLGGSKENRNLAHDVCAFFSYRCTHPFRPSFKRATGSQNSSLNPTQFGDPTTLASKILTSPYYSLKFLYSLRSTPYNWQILWGKIRSPWIFANLFITRNTCYMSFCIFRFG